MKTTIWKYDIEVDAIRTIKMPVGAKILDFKIQSHTPRIWAIVEPENELEERNFYCIGTGHNFEVPEDKLKYIGSVIFMGSRIYHLFEII